MTKSSQLDSDRTLTRRLARIIRAGRKSLGINQSRLAQELGIDQSALSRVESSRQNITAQQWFQFCQFLGIFPDCLSTGLIEFMPGSRRDFSGPLSRLPRKYSIHPYSKVRSAQMVISEVIRSFGEDGFESYLEAQGVDGDYLCVLDHPLNLNFSIDMVKKLLQSNSSSSSSRKSLIQRMSKHSVNPAFHGSLQWQYDFAFREGRLKLCEVLIGNMSYYDQNFEWKTENVAADHFDIAVVPKAHLRDLNYHADPDVLDFYGQWTGAVLGEFLAQGKSGAVPVEILENGFQDSKMTRCMYRIQTSA